MEDKLVNVCIKILRLLPPDGLHFNAIFKQTGLSYKPDVVEAVGMLGKGKLIRETKTPTHKQKKIKQPTELGYELKHLMVSIEEYNEAFLKFERSRVEKIDDDEPSPSILRSRGWSKEEIDMYDQTWYGTSKMKDFLVRTIFNALISRFAAIVQHIEGNYIAREILTKFVTIQIAHQLSIISAEYTNIKGKYAMHVASQELISEMDEDIPEFYHNPEYFLYNHLITNQIKDVIASLLYLVTPMEIVKKYATIQIAGLKYSIQQLEQELPTKRQKRKHGAELRGDKELLDIFERLLHRSS
jgi:hypothetical protein